jgi:hypothetical protein
MVMAASGDSIELLFFSQVAGLYASGQFDTSDNVLRNDFLGAETIGPMRRALQSFHPWAVRPVNLPKVKLRIRDEHGCLKACQC